MRRTEEDGSEPATEGDEMDLTLCGSGTCLCSDEVQMEWHHQGVSRLPFSEFNCPSEEDAFLLKFRCFVTGLHLTLSHLRYRDAKTAGRR